jgi:D-tyrosyl-tRNA(Tyr) deacylase
MRAVVQRVSRAQVLVEGKVVGQIGRGFLVLVGFTHNDGETEIAWCARKIAGLRVFDDAEGKMNLALGDVEGKVLAVSQFTLYADILKGRRPAFVDAAEPGKAEVMYHRFCELLGAQGIRVERGIFGAKMEVSLVNDGPVTIIIEPPTKNAT